MLESGQGLGQDAAGLAAAVPAGTGSRQLVSLRT